MPTNALPPRWFLGQPDAPHPDKPQVIEAISRADLLGPELYEAEPGLAEAVNTALLLDQPLLVSGEPGTGKTQLAEKLALELGLTPLFRFETKSASVAQDLFYTFDHVARFHAASASRFDPVAASGGEATGHGPLHPLRFVEYHALGRAILQSLPRDQAQAWFADGVLPTWYRGPQRGLVLIDEIDKAPSDFPNDALNEIERHYFRLREFEGREVQAARSLRPVVVITSNSEKQLPDAFLRRCIFHHLAPITGERLERIVLSRLSKSQGLTRGKLLDDAKALFFELRSPQLDLRKKPSTAEFLSFVIALMRDGARSEQSLSPEMARSRLSTLIKAPEDREAALRSPRLATR